MTEVRDQVEAAGVVEVRTVSMYPRQWSIVDARAELMGGSRSWALRHIVEEWDRLCRRGNGNG